MFGRCAHDGLDSTIPLLLFRFYSLNIFYMLICDVCECVYVSVLVAYTPSNLCVIRNGEQETGGKKNKEAAHTEKRIGIGMRKENKCLY